MKQIQLQTKAPIEIEAGDLLETINDIRIEHSKTKKAKAPIQFGGR